MWATTRAEQKHKAMNRKENKERSSKAKTIDEHTRTYEKLTETTRKGTGSEGL